MCASGDFESVTTEKEKTNFSINQEGVIKSCDKRRQSVVDLVDSYNDRIKNAK